MSRDTIRRRVEVSNGTTVALALISALAYPGAIQALALRPRFLSMSQVVDTPAQKQVPDAGGRYQGNQSGVHLEDLIGMPFSRFVGIVGPTGIKPHHSCSILGEDTT